MARIMKELRIDAKGKRLEYSFIHNGMVFSYDTEDKAIKELMRLNKRKKMPNGYLWINLLVSLFGDGGCFL